MSAAGKAQRPVLILLFLFVTVADAIRGSVAIRGGVRIGDTDIKNRRRPSAPESVDSNVPADFRKWCGVVGPGILNVPTLVD